MQSDYLNNIRTIIKKTKEKKLKWKRQNPTTLFYEIVDSKAERNIISIQKLKEGRSGLGQDKYIFNAINSGKEVVVNLTAALDVSWVDTLIGGEGELYSLLKELYNVADRSIEREGIDFLDDLINRL